MKKHFTPRKKKISGPIIVGAVKNVRIDSNTIIQCSTSISDEDARERFYNNHKDEILHPIKKEHVKKKVHMGLIEDFLNMDDYLLPELE